MPLNDFLFKRLQQEFGTVLLANEGEAMSGHYVPGTQPRFEFDHPGEYYRINCPFCTDTRHRLWVHHKWGVPDIEENSRLWSTHCYNEECVKDYNVRMRLFNRIYKNIGRDRIKTVVKVEQGIQVPLAAGEVDMPQGCVPLNALDARHPAIEYIVNRGFHPDHLQQNYGVQFGYHYDPAYHQAHERLVVPVIMRGKVVNWQARHVGEANWKKVSKYYNRPGTNKRVMLYGFDDAVLLPFCIIVEGVTDVWAIGPGAVSILGKKMSSQQAGLIVENWQVAVIVLDEDAKDDSMHALMTLRQKIPVANVTLPEGRDPGSYTHAPDELWDIIYTAANQQNLDLLAFA
jgi:hypothetical protein